MEKAFTSSTSLSPPVAMGFLGSRPYLEWMLLNLVDLCTDLFIIFIL